MICSGWEEGGGETKRNFSLKLFPLVHVILLTSGLVIRFPLWIVGFQGNSLISEAKDGVSCYLLVYEKTLWKKGNLFGIEFCMVNFYFSQLH